MSYMNFPFPVQPEYTGISLAYRNTSLIADEVSPRVPVGAREFKWLQMNRADRFTIPDTLVGRKSEPTQVEFGGTEQSGFVKDRALDDVVPQEDIDGAYQGYDPLGSAIEGITELLALDREKRVADQYFASSTYPAANRTTLSGTSQWSDYVNSDPYTAMMTAMDGMLMRPNTMVIGRVAWNRLRVHPKITAAVVPSATGNTGTSNAQGTPATLQAVANLLEIERILVGEAWYNSAKPGQTAVMARLWGKHCALLHQRPLASLRGNGITFGATAEYGTRVAGTLANPFKGMRGSIQCRAGESVQELVIANDVGYFFQDCIA